jgi:hypothetical protein
MRTRHASSLAIAVLFASALFARAAHAASAPAPSAPENADDADTVVPSRARSPASEFPKTAVELGVGPTGLASTWRGDGGAGGSARLGLLLFGVLAPDVLMRLRYTTVDDRLLTYLSIGMTGYLPLGVVRPYARLAFVHQHEESRAAIEDGPGNAALGVGTGIRHRAGFAGGLGIETPVARMQHGRSLFTLGGDVTATQFPDPRGPSTYVDATLWVTLHHAL